MESRKEGELVLYDMVSPGWEAEYTGLNDLSLVVSNAYLLKNKVLDIRKYF